MSSFVDFGDVKNRVSITKAIEFLGLEMLGHGHQLRGKCPTCGGGDRTLVVTPAKSLFFCFAAKVGGDQIALAAHIRNCKSNEAATWLVELLQGTVQYRKNHAAPEPQNQQAGTNRPQPRNQCPVLDYLESEHEAVVAVGLEPGVAKALGIGYAPKGTLRGSVAIPIRLEDGTLAGYIGVSEPLKLPKQFFLDTNVVPFKKGVA